MALTRSCPVWARSEANIVIAVRVSVPDLLPDLRSVRRRCSTIASQELDWSAVRHGGGQVLGVDLDLAGGLGRVEHILDDLSRWTIGIGSSSPATDTSKSALSTPALVVKLLNTVSTDTPASRAISAMVVAA